MSHTFYKAGIASGLVLGFLLPLSALAGGGPVGAVYTMSNAAEGNSILVFDRDPVGKLTPAGEFDTGGLGTGAGLGNQGGVILDPANRWLFVVNAGSDDISVFAIDEDGLTLVDREPSGGENPVSLTVISPSVGTTETAACWAIVSHDDRFTYTTNAGSGTISGYRVGFDGSLALFDANGRTGDTDKDSGPLDMAFSNDGRNLYTLNGQSDTFGVVKVKDKGGLPA